MGVRKTTEDFISRAKKVHPKKYDYSSTIYVKNNLKVSINCPKHGIFFQAPSGHLSGKGCKSCGVEQRAAKRTLRKEDVLIKLEGVHPNKYSFNLEGYKTTLSKIKVVCPKHGTFNKRVSYLLNGQGCVRCSYENHKGLFKNYSTEFFLNKAKEVHGYFYNYDKVEYVAAIDKVKILCSNHGYFWQTPHSHLNGSGCIECGWKKTAFARRKKLDDFVADSNLTHNNLYDYSNVKYKNTETKVNIICNLHGEFYQTPGSHLSGYGCPTCGIILSSYNCRSLEDSKSIVSGVYIMDLNKDGLYKIGTSKNTTNRMYPIVYETKGYYAPTIVHYRKMSLFNAASLEDVLHKKYKELKQLPEVCFAGQTECFSKDLPINEVIEQIETFNIL